MNEINFRYFVYLYFDAMENILHALYPILTHSHTITPFDTSRKEAFLKTLWEKEKLLVQVISPFSTMFSTLSRTEIIIFVIFNLSSANAFNFVWSKILSCGNGLKNTEFYRPCRGRLKKTLRKK